MKIKNLELKWLGHASFKIIHNNKNIYIDPYQLANPKQDADFILITHDHYDHCSQQDIEKIVKKGAIIICTPDSQSKISRISQQIHLELIEPGKDIIIDDIKIRAIESYNINKKFHPKAESWVGYILQLSDVIIYHAGDTDNIKEMEKLSGYGKKGNYFVILLPVGGTYTMNAEEASKAASLIKPNLAIPMHYGTIIGSRNDAETFINLCKKNNINAEILEKE